MEDKPVPEESPDRLEGPHSPARSSAAARHEDTLSPAKELRDRVAGSRSERVGDTTPVGGPVTSPPEL